MNKIVAIIKKILLILPAVISRGFGILQALVKVIKETLTLIMDILVPVIPIANFKIAVQKLRDGINFIDAGLEWLKQNILTKYNLI